MGNIENTIKNVLIDEFNPSILSVTNESYMHNVPEGSESHFKIILVTDSFKDVPKIKNKIIIYLSIRTEAIFFKSILISY